MPQTPGRPFPGACGKALARSTPWSVGSRSPLAKTQDPSIATLFAGYRTGKDRLVPSSPSLTTSMPTRHTFRRRDPGSASVLDPGAFSISSSWSEDGGRLDKSQLPPKYRELVRDSYDNCLSYLDSQLGELFDTLERRGVLENTLVVVTSDHGEELGEHGLSEHGESLYRPEIHVPLLIILPGRGNSREVVRETVSLRDLPATITDLVGMKNDAPFPGSSLARLWRDLRHDGGSCVRVDDGAISELGARIQPIRVKAGHPLREVRWSRLPKRTMSISATRGTGGSNYFTKVLIPMRSSISRRSKRCGLGWNASADVWIS